MFTPVEGKEKLPDRRDVRDVVRSVRLVMFRIWRTNTTESESKPFRFRFGIKYSSIVLELFLSNTEFLDQVSTVSIARARGELDILKSGKSQVQLPYLTGIVGYSRHRTEATARRYMMFLGLQFEFLIFRCFSGFGHHIHFCTFCAPFTMISDP